MILLMLACSTPPPSCPQMQQPHPLDSAKSSVRVRCPGQDAIALFDVSGGVSSMERGARLQVCAENLAAPPSCSLTLPLTLDAELPHIYESWESPFQQPAEVEGRDWKAQRSDGSWDVHGTDKVGEVILEYSVHVPMPR